MPAGPDPAPRGRGAIYRDAFGVPHLWADTVDDLAYVQGFEAAYERAWQLDYGRLRAEGRSAAVLGASALDWDVFARRARLVDTAQRSYDRLDGRTRAWCAAYVEGVNDALPAGAAGSAEFAALGNEPGRWQAWTPLAVFAGIHILFGTCQYKLWREHVADTLGPDLVDLFGIEGGASGGSNAYAVTAAHSPTGLPIIAGDPHRNLEVPNVYQQVRLACPAFDVAGLAFPGVPGIAHFGHAGSVAWATTNAMADYQDLYVEELRTDPANGRLQARGPGGWEPVVTHRTEQIDVRQIDVRQIDAVQIDAVQIDAVQIDAVRIDAVETARGPIVIGGPGERTYSLRTPSRTELDLGFAALLPLLHAQTVEDVETAMAVWVEPVNVLVIGDSTGRLRERVVGLVPDRIDANRRLPADPKDPESVWTGRYLHPDGRDAAVVINANDRASGAGLGFDYAPPERARRIRELVEAEAALTSTGLGAISLDTRQPAIRTLRSLLSELGSQLGSELDASAAAVREALLDWDGHADTDSLGGSLFAAWRWAFVGWLLDQPALHGLRADQQPLPALFARWVDPVIRVGSAWEQLALSGRRLGIDVLAGVTAALEAVAESRRADPSLTLSRWGTSHRFAPLHPLTGRAGAPDIPTTPLAGDAGCVLAARSYPGLTDACSFGPVARYVWDLADRSRSRWVVPLGASARTSSPHRVDQLALWARGETIPLATAWSALDIERVLPRPTSTTRKQR